MGACDDLRTFRAADASEALRLAEQIIEDDRHENGRSYSGSIGMARGVLLHRAAAALTETEATELILGRWEKDEETRMLFPAEKPLAEKWGPAILVEFRDERGDRWWMLGAVCSS